MNKGIIAFDTDQVQMNAGHLALMDAALNARLAAVRSDPTLQAQGPYVVADCALRWAQEVFREAKDAGTMPRDVTPMDLLLTAAMGLSDAIIKMEG